MKNQTLPEENRIDTVIRDVRALSEGDRVVWDDRTKPLVVRDSGTRDLLTIESEPVTQHAVEVEGDWANANTYLLVNQRDAWTGERTGKVILDMHHSIKVWRVN